MRNGRVPTELELPSRMGLSPRDCRGLAQVTCGDSDSVPVPGAVLRLARLCREPIFSEWMHKRGFLVLPAANYRQDGV